MIRRVSAILAGAMLCFVGVPTLASEIDWGRVSLQLSEGMTEQQLITAVGYSPNRAELRTCGGDTASGEWDCRILTFGNRHSNLTVFERREDLSWLINSWRVHPDVLSCGARRRDTFAFSLLGEFKSNPGGMNADG
jgi:hypothetical protein